MGPIKLCPNGGSIVIKDHLRPIFADHHAFPSKLAILLVQIDMTDVRHGPTAGRGQGAVELQEFIDADFGGRELVEVNTNSVPIADQRIGEENNKEIVRPL